MSIPDEAMAEYYRLLLGAEHARAAAESGEARAGDGGSSTASTTPGPGRRPRQHFDRLFVQREAPDEIQEIDLGPYLGAEAMAGCTCRG